MGSILDVSASPLSPHRRAKSLDRRSTESSMTVRHQGRVLCLGGGCKRPFPGRSSENWAVCCFPHNQDVGYRIHADLEQVSVRVIGAQLERAALLTCFHLLFKTALQGVLFLHIQQQLGNQPFWLLFFPGYPISSVLCSMCWTLML